MQKFFTLRVAMYFVIATFSFSCMSTSKFVSRANLDVSKVPAGFNPKKHILLVAEMPRLNNPKQRNNSVTAKLDKALQENYPYKYEIVSLKDIYENTSKYGDTSVYKYALLNSLSIYTRTTTTTRTTGSTQVNGAPIYGTSRTTTTTSPSVRIVNIDFGFYDRANNQRYPNSGNSTTSLKYTVAALAAMINKAKGS